MPGPIIFAKVIACYSTYSTTRCRGHLFTHGSVEQSTYTQHQRVEEARARPHAAAETQSCLLAPDHPATTPPSLPPAAVVLQFLQLLLHQVGLSCGLGELQHTVNGKSEQFLQPAARAAGLTLGLQPGTLPRTRTRAAGHQRPSGSEVALSLQKHLMPSQGTRRDVCAS